MTELLPSFLIGNSKVERPLYGRLYPCFEKKIPDRPDNNRDRGRFHKPHLLHRANRSNHSMITSEELTLSIPGRSKISKYELSKIESETLLQDAIAKMTMLKCVNNVSPI